MVKHQYEYYFRVLGLPPGASARTIKQRYRRLARQYHPDVNPGDPRAEERFKRISEAYRILMGAVPVEAPFQNKPPAPHRAQARARHRARVRPLPIAAAAGITIAFFLLVGRAQETQALSQLPGSFITAEQGLNRILKARLKTGSTTYDGLRFCHDMGFREVYLPKGPARAEALLGSRAEPNAAAIAFCVEAVIPPSSVFFTPGQDTRLLLCYDAHNRLIDQGVFVGHDPQDHRDPSRQADNREPPSWMRWLVNHSEPRLGSKPKPVVEQR